MNMQADLENTGKPKRRKTPKSVWVGLVVILFLLIVWLLHPAYVHLRESSYRVQSMNNLHQIGTAMNSYVGTYTVFPPAVVYDKEGKPLLSWRVLLLPHMEERGLYMQFKLDEPWDSPNNKPLLAQMPQIYMPPSQREPKEPYTTHYQVFTGGGAMFEANPQARPLTLQQIASADGTSKTLMVVEAANPVPWTKPDDLSYSPDQPLPKLGGLFKRKDFTA
jgi:Protein of unknown function (DUF1559)